ncbi:uncharacterized protein LOC119600439 [Lucilia sericata]|uniref:uncharacterized protein LOC119600439 n=1 Tax=Lucilia sericata TaxID=13632 RepID=UPI0018A8754A|nr:uncharacterized protein LOC119600439 [Lucilia sericata]
MWLRFIITFVCFQQIRNEEILRINKFEMETKLVELIKTAGHQHKFQTVLLKYDETVDSCGELDFYIKFLNSTIIIENLHRTWYVKGTINTNILSVVCLKGLTTDFKIELDSYFESLKRIRDTKMIFYINHNESANYLTKLEDFFKYCWQQKSLNVIAVFKDYYLTKYYYAYRPFPKFKMEFKVNTNNSEIFPYRLKDIMGYTLLTLPDQAEPRTYLTYLTVIKKKGKIKISGYVGHFIHLLAERLNATLKFPFPVKKGELLFYGYLENLARNYTIDIAGTVVPVLDIKYLLDYSYPYQITNICLMIPLAKTMPLKEIFFHMMNGKVCIISVLNLYLFTMVLNVKKLSVFTRQTAGGAKNIIKFSDLILNDVALRGILGQPFKMWLKAGFVIKCIYVLLSLTGLYLSLTYVAFLQTLLTRPLKEKQLKTFSDLRQNKIYTLVSDSEVSHYENMGMSFNLLLKTVSYEEFTYLRSHLNNTYAYPTDNMKWETLVNQQQNMFKNKIFMFSNDACFLRTNFLSFPQAENSIYREPLHNLIMLVRDHGLVERWFQTNFLDMLAAGKSTLIDFSVPKEEKRPLRVDDMELVFI